MKLSRVAAITLVLVLSACGTGPFSIADELGFPTIDMSESDDPAVRASSEAWEATVATQDAEDALERAIAEDDLTAVREAAALRPEDPRYVIMEDVLISQRTLDDVCVLESVSNSEIGSEIGNCADNPSVSASRGAAISKAQELIRAQNPDKPDQEIRRIWFEMRLDALHELIEANPDHPNRRARVAEYCSAITGLYPDHFAGADSSLYLATVAASGGLDICE